MNNNDSIINNNDMVWPMQLKSFILVIAIGLLYISGQGNNTRHGSQLIQ